jgi:SAM-dependent methyltransferase
MELRTQPVSADQPVVWEDVPCPLCNSRAHEELLSIAAEPHHAYRLARCLDCGLGYLNPRPNAASIGRYYPPEYNPHQAPARRSSWRQHLSRWFAGAASPADANSLTSLPLHGEGRLLDFGCGGGWYAHRMQQRGWDVTGIDFSARAAAEARRRFQFPVHVGSLPHPAIVPASFDVITMGAVLEHMHHPHEIIAAAAQALKPGGLLVIVVQNLDSWGFRHFQQDWFPLDLPIHLLQFTPATLSRLVADHGFAISRLEMIARAGWMRRSFAMARNRRAPGRRPLLLRLGSFRPLVNLLTRWTVRTDQADCIRLIARRA